MTGRRLRQGVGASSTNWAPKALDAWRVLLCHLLMIINFVDKYP